VGSRAGLDAVVKRKIPSPLQGLEPPIIHSDGRIILEWILGKLWDYMDFIWLRISISGGLL
jgi:hypothetical protein